MNQNYFVQIIGVRSHLFEDHVRQLGSKVEVISHPDEILHEADICLACGVYYILKPKYLGIPRLGIWGFHQSPLPKGRGGAPIHWTVLQGGTELTVSFFKLVDKMDEGPLLGQINEHIQKTDLLEDLRAMEIDLSKKLLNDTLIGFLKGEIQPYEQTGEPTYNRMRTPKDSELNPSKTLRELWDLIRTCDNEKYPAWFKINGEKFVLKRYHDDQSNS